MSLRTHDRAVPRLINARMLHQQDFALLMLHTIPAEIRGVAKARGGRTWFCRCRARPLHHSRRAAAALPGHQSSFHFCQAFWSLCPRVARCHLSLPLGHPSRIIVSPINTCRQRDVAYPGSLSKAQSTPQSPCTCSSGTAGPRSGSLCCIRQKTCVALCQQNMPAHPVSTFICTQLQ